MARPKKSNRNEMATVKIEDAFWRLLETERYSDISVLRICQEAGTNRNSFYYHYKDLDDLASTAFANNATDDVSSSLLLLLLSFQEGPRKVTTKIDPELLRHSRRIMLCAGSESVFLNRLVRSLLKQVWFKALAIEEAQLSALDRFQVDFIFSGLIDTLGRSEIIETPSIMAELAQTGIGRAAIETMKNIAVAQK